MPGNDIDAPVVVEALSIAVPPCSSVVTVNVLAVHCAVSVTLLATVPEDGYVAAAAYVVEPSLQPANVYPVRVYVFVGVVKVDPDNTDTGDTGAVPEPEPAAYEIVSVGIVGVASADAAE